MSAFLNEGGFEIISITSHFTITSQWMIPLAGRTEMYILDDSQPGTHNPRLGGGTNQRKGTLTEVAGSCHIGFLGESIEGNLTAYRFARAKLCRDIPHSKKTSCME